jgi:hypothetical protein
MKRSGQRESRSSGNIFKVFFENVRGDLFFGEAVNEPGPSPAVLGTFEPILKHVFRNGKLRCWGRSDENLACHAPGLSACYPLSPLRAHAESNYNELLYLGVIRDGEHVARKLCSGVTLRRLIGSPVPSLINENGSQARDIQICKQTLPGMARSSAAPSM